MALTHVDIDGGGSNTSPYDTWAKATASIQTGLTTAAAGGACFVQGAAADTAATARTLTSPGTLSNPTKLIGVKDGTTNEGTSIVASDLVVRGTDTLPQFTLTGGGNDLTLTGIVSAHGIHFTSPDRIIINGLGERWSTNDCKFSFGGLFFLTLGAVHSVNPEFEFTSTSSAILGRQTGNSLSDGFIVHGGVSTFTASPAVYFFAGATSLIEFTAHDLSGFGNNTLMNVDGNTRARVTFKNCRVPATFTEISTAFTTPAAKLELIGCSSDSTKGATTSYQDYIKRKMPGDIDIEQTIIRTGGADDGASGGFSYAMTPNINSTLEGSQTTLRSPWMNVWLAGGANTLTAYIANDTASTDFNEDEVWFEFYTPDAGDTAQHDQNFDPALERLLDSTTVITDDTGSTWGTGGNNHQKLSVTVTTGFEGFAYCRLHFAKRYASSPATLYLDPKIAVT